MKKRSIFSIPSFVIAGLTPAIASGSSTDPGVQPEGEPGFLDKLESIVVGIDESHEYTLAGHSSHSSHGSHRSHHSHYQSAPSIDGENERASRNEMSTPRSAVLPSSPAIAKKKLKVLPGNSGKFQKTVTRLQIALAAKGYDVGRLDGQASARTFAAVYEYQRSSGMVPSGKISNQVLSSLGIVTE